MRKFLLALAFTAVLLALVGGFWLPPRQPKVPPKVEIGAAGVPNPTALPSARVKRLFQGPRAVVTGSVPTLSKPCRDFFSALRSLDLGHAFEAPNRPEQLPDGKACSSVPAEVASWDRGYREACLGKETGESCLTALFFYRAALTEWLTRDVPVAHISDPTVLTDKLFARFRSDPAGAAEVAEKLLELEPEMYPAAKAAVLSRLMDAQAHAAGDPKDPRWKKVDDLQFQSEKMQPGDASDQFETRMIAQALRYREPDPGPLRERAGDMIQRHPESGVGYYYMAWAEYRSGRVKEALAWLSEADRHQKNPRHLETAVRIKNGEAEPFRANFSVSLDPSRYLN